MFVKLCGNLVSFKTYKDIYCQPHYWTLFRVYTVVPGRQDATSHTMCTSLRKGMCACFPSTVLSSVSPLLNLSGKQSTGAGDRPWKTGGGAWDCCEVEWEADVCISLSVFKNADQFWMTREEPRVSRLYPAQRWSSPSGSVTTFLRNDVFTCLRMSLTAAVSKNFLFLFQSRKSWIEETFFKRECVKFIPSSRDPHRYSKLESDCSTDECLKFNILWFSNKMQSFFWLVHSIILTAVVGYSIFIFWVQKYLAFSPSFQE